MVMKTRNNIRIVYLHLLNVIQISSTCRFNNLFPVHCVLHYILYILCNTCSIDRLTSQWVLYASYIYIYIWSTAPGDGLKIRDLRSDIGIYLCISFVIESSHNNYQYRSHESWKYHSCDSVCMRPKNLYERFGWIDKGYLYCFHLNLLWDMISF